MRERGMVKKTIGKKKKKKGKENKRSQKKKRERSEQHNLTIKRRGNVK